MPPNSLILLPQRGREASILCPRVWSRYSDLLLTEYGKGSVFSMEESGRHLLGR